MPQLVGYEAYNGSCKKVSSHRQTNTLYLTPLFPDLNPFLKRFRCFFYRTDEFETNFILTIPTSIFAPMKSICVFCGSSLGVHPEYARMGEELGKIMANEDIRLVYGGGKVGIMGVVADGVLNAGGEVIGVIPDFLHLKERAHPDVTEMIITTSMHERKAKMEQLSDGFITLPGGMGTMDELCEIFTWAQLGLHQKPVGILNVSHYFDPFIQFLNHMTTEQFIHTENRQLIQISDNIEKLLRLMGDYDPPQRPKWMTSDQT